MYLFFKFLLNKMKVHFLKLRIKKGSKTTVPGYHKHLNLIRNLEFFYSIQIQKYTYKI